MEKTVKSGERIAAVALDGSECAVKFSSKYTGFEIKNNSGGDVIVSLEKGRSNGDGVVTLGNGDVLNYMHGRKLDTVYLTGSGSVTVAAKNDGDPVFPVKGKGGGSGGGSGNASITVDESERIPYYHIDSNYKLLEGGNCKYISGYALISYKVAPGSWIWVKALDEDLECKFIFQDSFYDVPSSFPNTHLIGDPQLSPTNGLIKVPEGAGNIIFSILTDDKITGLYDCDIEINKYVTEIEV